MTTRLKFFLLGLSLFCVAVLAAALVYQRHLRFLMEDWTRLAAPSVVVDFPAPHLTIDSSALVLDGIRLPFAESEITDLRCVPFAESGIDSTRHPSTTEVLICQLMNGVEVGISFPKQDYAHVDALLYEFDARRATPRDFSWRMTSNELEELCNKISYQRSRAKVARVGWRKEANGTAIFRDYSSRTELEWRATEGTWNGCVHFSFKEASEFQNDPAKQLEFVSRLEIASKPNGTFEQEVEALFERIRTKDPSAIMKDPGTN